jgi:hypothetical protein
MNKAKLIAVAATAGLWALPRNAAMLSPEGAAIGKITVCRG